MCLYNDVIYLLQPHKDERGKKATGRRERRIEQRDGATDRTRLRGAESLRKRRSFEKEENDRKNKHGPLPTHKLWPPPLTKL